MSAQHPDRLTKVTSEKLAEISEKSGRPIELDSCDQAFVMVGREIFWCELTWTGVSA